MGGIGQQVCSRTAPDLDLDQFCQRAKSFAAQGVEMKKIVSALGLLVALSLGAIAWIGGSDVMAHEGVAACETGQSAFDDGYGVSAGCVRR